MTGVEPPAMEPLFVLIHSPLVGPLTWEPVAVELRRRGARTLVPSLRAASVGLPYWAGHVAAVVAALQAAGAADAAPVLVSHSGAGVLLPAVGAALGRPLGGYVFVDSDLPQDGRSRLDLFAAAHPAAAAEFRAAADAAGLLPPWTETDLAEDIPDPDLRCRFVAELQPLPLAVYEEAIPVPAAWPDAPCGYVHFSPPYAGAAAQARARAWPVVDLPGSHFRLLTDPVAVADALLGLSQEGYGGSRRV
ncbi:MAG: alpha/beta hydrolase [Chloroflexota bacterium]|nr:alpha/beta hydrolase [Chloroflexota bacterium]